MITAIYYYVDIVTYFKNLNIIYLIYCTIITIKIIVFAKIYFFPLILIYF